MSADKKPGINDAITKLLGAKLRPFTARSLDLVTCTEIYQVIFDTLVEVATTAETGLTNEAMNFTAQCYYDAVAINGNQELDPNIFTQRASVSNMETKELALLVVMLHGTDFTIPLLQEIKRRS